MTESLQSAGRQPGKVDQVWMVISRRAFLRQSAIVTGLVFAPQFRARAERPTEVVSVLHTTDLHGNILPTQTYEGVADVGGFARCATQIGKWREEFGAVVVVDAGDVYQGTQVGLSTEGRIMIDGFNQVGYDAWVFGNHDFDWGFEPFTAAIERSGMPVLASNALIDGRLAEAADPAKTRQIQPFTVVRAGDYRVGVIGVTTPGTPYWLEPSFLGDFLPVDPIEPVHRAIQLAREAGVDALILVGHMGVRPVADDFANRVHSLAAAFPEVSIYVAGHTHRPHPGEQIRGVHYTQASYFGIHCGRADLHFDPESRRVVRVESQLVEMNASVPQDPAILSLAAPALAEAEAVMATVVGRLREPLSAEQRENRPSEVERLIGSAIVEGLEARGEEVAGVWHGAFGRETLPEAPMTIADLWRVLPYENFIVTGRLTPEQLRLLLESAAVGVRSPQRSLMGFDVVWEGERVRELRRDDGTPLKRGERLPVAFNSYDAVSGGQRMMRLRMMLEEPESGRRLVPLQTREALIAFFRDRESVGRSDLRWG